MNLLERIHGSYVHRRRVEVLSRHIAEMLPPKAAVLDVGCGDGRLARHIQGLRPDASVTGLDVLVRAQTEILVHEFDGRRIPGEAGSVDVVVFVDVLHHAEDPMVLLREAHRVARHGIVIKDHLVEGLLAWPTLRFMDRIGNRRHGVSIPHNYWTRSQWDRAFRELGLASDVWRGRLGLYPAPASWLFERSLHFLAYLRPTTNVTHAARMPAVPCA